MTQPADALPADLAHTVNDQAQARVEMNIQGYAKYLTPEAIDTLRASFPGIPPRVNRFEIDAATENGGDYTVDIRYFSRDDSFVVRSRWHSAGAGWMVVRAERIWAEGDKKPGLLSRLTAKVLGPMARRRRG
jgi:hypothetical protein